jgi:hypothetical protein
VYLSVTRDMRSCSRIYARAAVSDLNQPAMNGTLPGSVTSTAKAPSAWLMIRYDALMF